MKNKTWIEIVKEQIAQAAPSGKPRHRQSQCPQGFDFTTLESRQLLATVAYTAATEALVFTADVGQADVVSVSSPAQDQLQLQLTGDSFALSGDAVANGDFVLSQTNTSNDTLTIDLAGSSVSSFLANLGDLDDLFTASSFSGITSVVVNGEAGNDSIDASMASDSTTLTGGAGNDTLTGGSGNDTLAGGGGTDTISGGLGTDTNSFAGISLGVTATVAADGSGTASYGTVSEVFSGVENLTGSDNNDVLVATGAAANVLIGGAGDDVLAGGGGTDIIDGGIGIDTNSFAGIGLAVTATIAEDGSGTAAYGGVNETFTGIENLTGSDNDDSLTGNGLANVIDGGLGNDTIVGGAGDDVLFGGSGQDIIQGDAGNDRLIGGFGDDTLTGGDGDDSLIGNGQITITLANLNPTEGSLLTPIVVATQNGIYDQFDVGSAASESIERLAEDGTVGPRIAAALGSGGVREAQATAGGPVAPGETRTLTFFADPTDPLTQYISYASMVIPSNDAFIGNDDPTQIDLFDDEGNLIRRVGSDAFIVSGDNVYDAGTEVNDEVPANTAALAQAAPNTGVTEGGVIRQHEGFQGSERLGGPIGNVLTARSGSDFTTAGFEVLSIEVDSASRQTGFSVAVENQPFASLTTSQTPAELIEEATNDRLYYNVHTTDFAGGEIRGQLILQSDTTVDGVRTILLEAALDSAQEPGGTSDSEATGSGLVSIVDDGLSVSYSSQLSISGITTADLLPVAGVSSIHLHNAEAGQNGAVITDIIQDAGGDISGEALSAAADTSDGNVFVEEFESDNDRLIGGNGDDTLSGGDGNDQLLGGNGNDQLFGQAGNDVLSGGGGNDNLNGGDGDDFLQGLGGTDVINGGAGVDINSFQGIGVGVTATLFGDGSGSASYAAVAENFVGIESLSGSENDDTLAIRGTVDGLSIRGLGGNDVLLGGNGGDLLVGGEGDDSVFAGDGNDQLLGQAGNDVLSGGSGNDFLSGDDGDDFLQGLGGTDSINGGSGQDINSFQGISVGVTAYINDAGSGTASYGAVEEFFSGIESLSGSENDDTLVVLGSSVGRTLRGLGGNDTLLGGGAADLLVGGDGDDTILGRGNNDSLLGGTGNDRLDGGDGDDFVRGDAGNDEISGGLGADTLIGGDGNDTLFGNAGRDFLFGSIGNDSLFGGTDDDRLFGEDGDDLLAGGLGTDLLDGGLGTNELFQ